jgi:putative ABC transport system permease protein
MANQQKILKIADWDAYRNNSIGFIFQSYNLIGHLGIIENVELRDDA